MRDSLKIRWDKWKFAVGLGSILVASLATSFAWAFALGTQFNEFKNIEKKVIDHNGILRKVSESGGIALSLLDDVEDIKDRMKEHEKLYVEYLPLIKSTSKQYDSINARLTRIEHILDRSVRFGR
jgi:hypothetical protein